MGIVDVSLDRRLCAFVCNNELNIYDVCKSELLLNVKEKSDTIITKILKISPSKDPVAWLQSTPNQLSLVGIHSRVTTYIKSQTDFPFCHLMWSPNGEFLAAFSNLSLFIKIYKVENEKSSFIASICGSKLDQFSCPIAQFSPDGDYFATVSICSQGHSIKIYSTENSCWDCVQSLVTSEYHEVGGFLWCQDSASFLLWQSGLDLLMQLWSVDGRVEHKLSASAAPVSCVCLSACGRMAAVHSSDRRVRIIDLLTWQMGKVGVLVHCPIVHKSSSRSRLKESDCLNEQITMCEPITETLFELNHVVTRSNHRRFMQFSPEAQYLVTYEPVYPNTLWVWNLTSDTPLDTVIVLTEGTLVRGVLWHSHRVLLAVSLSHNKVLVWTPQLTVIVSPSKTTPWPLTAETYFASLYNSNCDEI